jgi:hypothetical protein
MLKAMEFMLDFVPVTQRFARSAEIHFSIRAFSPTLSLVFFFWLDAPLSPRASLLFSRMNADRVCFARA